MVHRITDTRLTLNVNDQFKNWLAGIIDGEGNFNLAGKGRNPQVRIIFEERDKFVLEYIQSKIGGKLYYRKPLKSWKSNWKPQWEFCIHSQLDCLVFTAWILPCLILKRDCAIKFMNKIKEVLQ